MFKKFCFYSPKYLKFTQGHLEEGQHGVSDVVKALALCAGVPLEQEVKSCRKIRKTMFKRKNGRCDGAWVLKHDMNGT
jgi:hypothetical protein